MPGPAEVASPQLDLFGPTREPLARRRPVDVELSDAQRAEAVLLDEVLQAQARIRQHVKTHRDAVVAEPWSLFARRMRVCSTQQSGKLYERWMCDWFGWDYVGEKEGRGDAVHGGTYHEIKVTNIDPLSTSPVANFVQIRPHHDCDYHLFVVEGDYRLVRFDLTKDQMATELELTGHKLAHGKKSDQAANGEPEFRIDFPWRAGHTIFDRWAAYQVTDVELPSEAIR